MKVKPHYKSYGLFQPTYLTTQVISFGFSYLTTSLILFPVVFLEASINAMQDALAKKRLEREQAVYAYNIPFTFANETLARTPVAKVSIFSKKYIGVPTEISVSLLSCLVATATTTCIGLVQIAIYTGVAALGLCVMAVGLAATAIAIIAQSFVKGPKAALNDTAEFLNTRLAI